MTDATADTVRAPATRLLYVDNLRVLLTVLVVLHHAAVTYSGIPLWYYTEPVHDPSSAALEVFAVLNQTYFMGFFFLISGFFTPGAYGRKGAGTFARDRLRRLGIPLLLFILVLRPVLTIPGALRSGVPYWLYYLESWDPGPTWFLEVLLVFALVYALVRRRRSAAAPVTGAAPARAAAPSGRAVVAFVVGLAAVTFGWQFLVPSGTYVPILGLPSPGYLPQYAAMFVVGLLAYRRGWFAALSRRAGRLGFVAAAVSLVVCVPPFLLTTGGVQALAMAVFTAVFSTGVIIGLTVWFRERFDRQSPFGRFLSQNAFAVYVLHPLIVTGLGYALAWLVAPALVKFVVLGALALPLCWGLAAAVRALPLGRKVF